MKIVLRPAHLKSQSQDKRPDASELYAKIGRFVQALHSCFVLRDDHSQQSPRTFPFASASIYNLRMVDITPICPDETAEARLVIYTTARAIFDVQKTLEEAVSHYKTHWPLVDIDDYQRVYVDNGGAFLVVREGGRIVGTGALHRLEDQVGEIKRLWLLPEYHGQGFGYQIMMQLLAVARDKGYTRVRLETDATRQSQAVRFYKRLGFYEIPRYGDDPDDIAFEFILE